MNMKFMPKIPATKVTDIKIVEIDVSRFMILFIRLPDTDR